MSMSKAPDKIYLNTSDGDYEFAEWNVVSYAEVTTEYISKDVLLKWAKKMQYDSTTIVADNFWQEVIDKLNSI